MKKTLKLLLAVAAVVMIVISILSLTKYFIV